MHVEQVQSFPGEAVGALRPAADQSNDFVGAEPPEGTVLGPELEGLLKSYVGREAAGFDLATSRSLE